MRFLNIFLIMIVSVFGVFTCIDSVHASVSGTVTEFVSADKETPEGMVELEADEGDWTWAGDYYPIYHYSRDGGFWANDPSRQRICDSVAFDAINKTGSIPYDANINTVTELPQEVKDYLAKDGSLSDIEVKFHVGYNQDEEEIFEGDVEYTLTEENIEIEFEPIFNVQDRAWVGKPEGVNPSVKVPGVREGYGSMLFAMWGVEGATYDHYGGYGIPEEEGIEKGLEFVVDDHGHVQPGSYELGGGFSGSNNAPAGTYTHNEIRVGHGTFDGGGGIGLNFRFPVSVKFYVPLEDQGYDLEVVDITQEGQPLEPVTENTATVTVGLKDLDIEGVDQIESRLFFNVDGEGWDSKDIILTNDETKTLDFEWVAPDADQANLEAEIIAIDEDLKSLDINPDNNIKDIDVDIGVWTNLYVKDITAATPVGEGNNVPITITIGNEGTEDHNTEVVVRVNGQEFANINCTSYQDTEQTLYTNWNADRVGNITIEAEINPSRAIEETRYDDNKASTIVVVEDRYALPVCISTSNDWDVTYTGRCYRWVNRTRTRSDGSTYTVRRRVTYPVSQTVTYSESFNITNAEMTTMANEFDVHETFDLLNDEGEALSGLPMSMRIETQYATNYENRIPEFCWSGPNPQSSDPNSLTLRGPDQLQVQWSNGSVINLERTSRHITRSGNTWIESSVWELPEIRTVEHAWERWYEISPDVPEGRYYHQIISNTGGVNHEVCDSIDFKINILGNFTDMFWTEIVE